MRIFILHNDVNDRSNGSYGDVAGVYSTRVKADAAIKELREELDDFKSEEWSIEEWELDGEEV